MLYVGQIAEGWQLLRPLALTIETDDDGSYIASDSEFAQYGEGPTRDEAIRDYIATLIEYFNLLEKRAKDHVPTRMLFRNLCGVVTRIREHRLAVSSSPVPGRFSSFFALAS